MPTRSGAVEELLEMGCGLDGGHLRSNGLVLEVEAAELLALDDDQLDAAEVGSVFRRVLREPGCLGRGVGEPDTVGIEEVDDQFPSTSRTMRKSG